MKINKLAFGFFGLAVGLSIGLATAVIARQSTDAPAQAPDMQLPPGWTEQDIQACMLAATPGEQHKKLMEDAGTWKGKTTMWMFPGSEPVQSECTATCTPIMDGRFLKVEWSGELPDMGPYNGMGIYGYDNVTEQFVTVSLDTFGTGIAMGSGQPDANGKVITWTYTYNCPVTQKPTTLRDVETFNSKDSKTMEMFGIDPKSGKEFQMMRIELTRQNASE